MYAKKFPRSGLTLNEHTVLAFSRPGSVVSLASTISSSHATDCTVEPVSKDEKVKRDLGWPSTTTTTLTIATSTANTELLPADTSITSVWAVPTSELERRWDSPETVYVTTTVTPEWCLPQTSDIFEIPPPVSLEVPPSWST